MASFFCFWYLLVIHQTDFFFFLYNHCWTLFTVTVNNVHCLKHIWRTIIYLFVFQAVDCSDFTPTLLFPWTGVHKKQNKTITTTWMQRSLDQFEDLMEEPSKTGKNDSIAKKKLEIRSDWADSWFWPQDFSLNDFCDSCNHFQFINWIFFH